jgi:hypothetical protein
VPYSQPITLPTEIGERGAIAGSERVDPLPVFRFLVEIDEIQQAAFMECTRRGSQTEDGGNPSFSASVSRFFHGSKNHDSFVAQCDQRIDEGCAARREVGCRDRNGRQQH